MRPEYIAAWLLSCGASFLVGTFWAIWRMAKDEKRWMDN